MFHETVRITVGAEDLEHRNFSCPFCDGIKSAGTGTYAQAEPPVEYLKCDSCFAYFTDRVPTARYLEKFYHHDVYEGTISKSDALAGRLAKSILSGTVLTELVGTSSELNVMDFGGGSGRLGLAVKHRLGRPDTRVTLVDLYEPSGDYGIDFLTPEELRSSRDSSFDLIVLSAVIEHLAHPGTVIADLYKRVRSGGFLYFRAPSLFPLGRVRPGLLRWPEHLSDLPPRFWHELPNLLGWKVEIVKSRPSQTSDRFRDSFLAALLSNFMKLPGHLESSISALTHWKYRPSYQCAGGWDVVYRKLE